MFALVSTPDPNQRLVVREFDEPVPNANEVLVEVKAFSLNRGELRLLELRPNGWRPGQDVAGVVVERAADGSGPDVGTRIVALLEMGGWAERVAVRTDRLAPLPDSVSFEQAATLPIAGLTALRTVRLGESLLGKTALITGARGGVGHFAVQLAAASGAIVTALASSQASAAQLQALGADEVVSKPSASTRVFDFAIESIGGETFRGVLGAMNPRGTVVVIGNASGEDARFRIYDFFGHEDVKILSFLSYNSPQTVSRDLAILVDLIVRGKLRPQIGLTRSWREINGNLIALRDRQFFGKAVFLVSE